MTNVNCMFLMSSGRLWCLQFYVAPDKKTSTFGRWAISLSIVDPSPPTWLDSHIIINGRGKSTIKFRLWTKSHQLQSPTPAKTKLARKKLDKLVANFAENATSLELQYPYASFCFSSRMRCSPRDCFSFSNSGYYSQDGTLQVTMEAQLKRSSTDTDCVVC